MKSGLKWRLDPPASDIRDTKGIRQYAPDLVPTHAHELLVLISAHATQVRSVRFENVVHVRLAKALDRTWRLPGFGTRFFWAFEAFGSAVDFHPDPGVVARLQLLIRRLCLGY
jgi:hypothetical protein